MKVVAFNGSPRKEGNTYQAIKIVTDELEKAGIDTEIIQVGHKAIRGCIDCGKCKENLNEKCSFTKDDVNEWIQKIKNADGVIFGSPVYYAGLNGTMKAFLDRAFYVANANGGLFRHKVGAAVVALRRSGGVTTFDQLNHYLAFSEMLIPSANYWNVIHGTLPGEALQDEEGVQIMRVLGKNMAWLLKLVQNGRGVVEEPAMEAKTRTNFIR
ncbi:MAG TPA: flavodoxin family protein [Syntrophomonadaceae bacterium]|nr:flavodoxin family protein [Syntrophomonadaceae bacterium]